MNRPLTPWEAIELQRAVASSPRALMELSRIQEARKRAEEQKARPGMKLVCIREMRVKR